MGVGSFSNTTRADWKTLRVHAPIELSHKSWFFAVLLIRIYSIADKSRHSVGRTSCTLHQGSDETSSVVLEHASVWEDQAYSPVKPVCQSTVRQPGQVFVKTPIILALERSSGVVFGWIASPPPLSVSSSVIALYFAMLKSQHSHFSEAAFYENRLISSTTKDLSEHSVDHRLITDQTLLFRGYYISINFKSGFIYLMIIVLSYHLWGYLLDLYLYYND